VRHPPIPIRHMNCEMTAPEYINLDLDIESPEDLTPLAQYLDKNACLLSHETVEDIQKTGVRSQKTGVRSCLLPFSKAGKIVPGLLRILAHHKCYCFVEYIME